MGHLCPVGCKCAARAKVDCISCFHLKCSRGMLKSALILIDLLQGMGVGGAEPRSRPLVYV